MYRQQMIDRLVFVLKAPDGDEAFVRWLTDGIYGGNRTARVMERLGRIAREAMPPAILRTLGDDFLATLRARISEATGDGKPADPPTPVPVQVHPAPTPDSPKPAPVTTQEEQDFLSKVREICVRAGESGEHLIGRDTQSYFNVSWKLPTRWFVRFFGDGKRKAVTTLVPVEEATALAPGFTVEPAPAAFGQSRVFLDSVDQVWGLARLITRSLELCKAGRQEVAKAEPG